MHFVEGTAKPAIKTESAAKSPTMTESLEVEHTEGEPPAKKVKLESSEATEVKPEAGSMEDFLGDVVITKVEPAKVVKPEDLVTAEMTRYKAEPQAILKQDPLQWWKVREAAFPILSKVAKRLLCIPATSVPSERTFSTAGLTINKRRSSLDAKTADMLIFLNKNYKLA
jgi:hypothetical protein